VEICGDRICLKTSTNPITKKHSHKTFAQIRKALPEDTSKNLSDDELYELYHEWSEMHFAAGWITPNEKIIAAFVEWATHTPIQLLKKEKEQ